MHEAPTSAAVPLLACAAAALCIYDASAPLSLRPEHVHRVRISACIAGFGHCPPCCSGGLLAIPNATQPCSCQHHDALCSSDSARCHHASSACVASVPQDLAARLHGSRSCTAPVDRACVSFVAINRHRAVPWRCACTPRKHAVHHWAISAAWSLFTVSQLRSFKSADQAAVVPVHVGWHGNSCPHLSASVVKGLFRSGGIRGGVRRV